MTRLPLWLLMATVHSCFGAYVTEPPSFAKRLSRLYEKLERFTLAPERRDNIGDKLNAKLDKLDALTPDKLADEDEELVSMMQMWGNMSDEQVRDVVKELQRIKEYDDKEKLADGEYSEDWNDEDTFLQDLEGDYAMDGEGMWDPLDDPDTPTSKPGSVVPSAITKTEIGYREIVVSAVDPVAATNERPRILDDTNLTPAERQKVRQAALANMATVMRAGKCSIPQPRWLPVRQLAPAADTVYMPPCVRLHRCAPDSGCCHSEAEVCAPIDGKYVTIPFYLNKVDGNLTFARMLFFNHTSCACVSRETLQSTARTKIDPHPSTEGQERSRERTVWRQTTEEPLPEKDEGTPPPQLRRCTCPVLFTARVTAGGACTCGCESGDAVRRRDCQWLAKGREHFGLRDRVCVASGDCTPPSCEVGRYDRRLGRCPRQFRRIRYHRSRHQDKPAEPNT